MPDGDTGAPMLERFGAHKGPGPFILYTYELAYSGLHRETVVLVAKGVVDCAKGGRSLTAGASLYCSVGWAAMSNTRTP